MAELKLVEGWTAPIEDTLTSNGVPVDLSGKTVELVLQKASGAVVNTTGSVTVPNPTGGVVRYKPGPTDLIAIETPHVMRWKATDAAGSVVFFPSDAADVWIIQPAAAVPLAPGALITLAEFKRYLKITNTDQDVVLADIINRCSRAAETYVHRPLGRRTVVDETLWVRAETVLDGRYWLDVAAPVTAITAFVHNGVAETTWVPGQAGSPLDAVVSVVGADQDRLYRAGGWVAGSVVTRSYTGGYGGDPVDPTTVPLPGDIAQAVLSLGEDWYYKRDRQSEPVIARTTSGETITYVNEAFPRQFRALLDQYRWRRAT